MTDFDVLQTTLEPSLFPNISKGIEVHSGFANDHAQCDLVLSPYSRPLLIQIAIAFIAYPLGQHRTFFWP